MFILTVTVPVFDIPVKGFILKPELYFKTKFLYPLWDDALTNIICEGLIWCNIVPSLTWFQFFFKMVCFYVPKYNDSEMCSLNAIMQHSAFLRQSHILEIMGWLRKVDRAAMSLSAYKAFTDSCCNICTVRHHSMFLLAGVISFAVRLGNPQGLKDPSNKIYLPVIVLK